MSLELWSTLASIATVFVIAATAVAALVQLRHIRASNQIAALSEVAREMDSDLFRTARQSLVEDLKPLRDPALRTRAANDLNVPELKSVTIVAGVYESLGSYVKFGALDAAIVIDQLGDSILATWRDIEPAIPIARTHSPFLWENFEYLVVLTEDFVASHPRGSYPSGIRRKIVPKS